MKSDLSIFYDDSKRLEYYPVSLFVKRRTGIKRLVAFDDRFEQVKAELEGIINNFFSSEREFPSEINQSSKNTLKVLDIGIGDGIYEAMLEDGIKEKCQFYGVDISSKQLDRAKKYLNDAKVVDLNTQKLPYPNLSFDIVVASEILEHVFYPENILKEAERVLKKGGFLLLTFPNSGSIHLRLSLLFSGSSPMLNYPQNQEHIRFFTDSDILKILGAGFKMIKKSGISSFLFDKWNFFGKIPMPRLVQIVGNKLFPNLALGYLLILQKK